MRNKTRDITIVGAGQGGLQLALGLIKDGHRVTVISNRTADEIENGRVMSSQCMFDRALQNERDLGINFWEQDTPKLEKIGIFVGDGGKGTAIAWRTGLCGYAQSLDQRIKMSGWLRTFSEWGGDVLIEEADVDALERYAKTSDLVVVAAGKGDIAGLFKPMPQYMPFDKPMRQLGMIFVRGMKRRDGGDTVAINIQPGIGEFVTFPALTTTGRCDCMTFEAVPGGPLDVWRDTGAGDVERFAALARRMIEEHFPWEAHRMAAIEPTDEKCTLVGAVPPTVREPSAQLPSGKLVLALGDTNVLNDPSAGQGSNNANRGAEIYRKWINERGDRAFTKSWMEGVFHDYWDRYAQWATHFSNILLVPPEKHMIDILAAAGDNDSIAQKLAQAFDNPIELSPWFYDAEAAEKFLSSFESVEAQR